MTHKEIWDLESGNTDRIYFHLEGSFWKVYERSAFSFCTYVKQFRVLRKDSKTIGSDILYIGFPESSLTKFFPPIVIREEKEGKLVSVPAPKMIDTDEFLQWRDSQEVAIAASSVRTPNTKVIEKAPVFKGAFDILTRSLQVSGNLAKNFQNPFGVRLKMLSYEACCMVRHMYDVTGNDRKNSICKALEIYDEISFLIQLLCDQQQISIKSFALLSEMVQSVSKQLLLLQRKVTA